MVSSSYRRINIVRSINILVYSHYIVLLSPPLPSPPLHSDVNKDLGFKAKAKDLSFKAKDLSFKAKAKDLRIGP